MAKFTPSKEFNDNLRIQNPKTGGIHLVSNSTPDIRTNCRILIPEDWRVIQERQITCKQCLDDVGPSEPEYDMPYEQDIEIEITPEISIWR
jgi:hypothetical protein